MTEISKKAEKFDQTHFDQKDEKLLNDDPQSYVRECMTEKFVPDPSVKKNKKITGHKKKSYFGG